MATMTLDILSNYHSSLNKIHNKTYHIVFPQNPLIDQFLYTLVVRVICPFVNILLPFFVINYINQCRNLSNFCAPLKIEVLPFLANILELKSIYLYTIFLCFQEFNMQVIRDLIILLLLFPFLMSPLILLLCL